MVKRILTVFLIVLLLVNDFVAWTELRHTLGWLLGDIAPVAAISMLFLANAVTMAFFFDGLRPRSIRLLHGIAGFLYLTVLIAVYAAAVQYGQAHFPANVAEDAFGMERERAIRAAALLIGAAFSGATYAFWSVMGQLISSHTQRGQGVAWQETASRHGLPIDNILDHKKPRATGS